MRYVPFEITVFLLRIFYKGLGTNIRLYLRARCARIKEKKDPRKRIRFVNALDLIKCLEQIKKEIALDVRI